MSFEFNQLLLTQIPRLRVFAMSLARNQHDADDLVQNTLALALRYESSFQVGTNFSGWTYRILKNRFISDRRGPRRTNVCLDDVSEAQVACEARQEEQMLSKQVLAMTAKLTPLLREALMLICDAELSYAQAAVALRCSIGTVKSRVCRARESIRALLDDAFSPAQPAY